jgi:hypothetical protein
MKRPTGVDEQGLRCMV